MKVRRRADVRISVGRRELTVPYKQLYPNTHCVWFTCRQGHRGWMIYTITYHSPRILKRLKQKQREAARS